MEVRDVEQDFIPYVGQLVFANVPVDGLNVDLMNMASLIVLSIVYDSLPTRKKLPILA